MCYSIIIRGPAGVGKTTVAEKIAARLGGTYISFDKLMRTNHLDKIDGVYIPEKNFIKADEIVIPEAIKILEKGRIVVFDGCFYHTSQVEHLVKNIPFNSFAFTLKAALDECILRDKKRSSEARIGENCVREVYDLASRFECGVVIDTTNKTAEEIIIEIVSRFPKNFS